MCLVTVLNCLDLLLRPWLFKESGSAMQLQPFKCKIVPCVQWNDSVRDRIKLWLELKLPGWSKFKVVPVAEYLALILGPAAKDHQWEDSRRVAAIASSGTPPSVSCFTYCTRCVSVFNYRAQLLGSPPEALALDRKWLSYAVAAIQV